MFDISNEFDEMYSLIGQMGFSGSDVDKIMGFILHSINQSIRSELKKWNISA